MFIERNGAAEMNEIEDIDIRTIRTRKNILDAFASLLSEKSFETIKISDISKKAMINRATFYNHFTDKYQLLDVLTTDFFLSHLKENVNTKEAFSQEFIKNLYLVLTSYHTKMSLVCTKNYIEELAFYTNRFLREEVKNTILNSIKKDEWLEVSSRGLVVLFSEPYSMKIHSLLRNHGIIMDNGVSRPLEEKDFGDGIAQKAGYHCHGDTLPLLAPVYRSAYSRRRTSRKQKTYPNPFS